MQTLMPNCRGRLLLFVVASMSLALLAGCSKSKKGTSSGDQPGIVDKAEADVTAEGGSVALKNGMTLNIPPGGVSAPVHVTVTQFSGDTNFTPNSGTVLDVDASGTLGNAQLIIPLAPGQDTALVGAAFMTPEQGMVRLNGEFNPANDTFTVALTPPVSARAAGIHAVPLGTYVVSAAPKYTPVTLSRILELPYYQQDGGNCWAAAMLIFMKSHKSSMVWDEIYEILHRANVDKDDGYGWYSMGSMETQCEQVTGLTAEKNTWIRFDNFVEYVFKCIDERKPVMVNLISHQGVICGYEILNPGATETVSFYMHDPQAWGTQLPYRKISLDELVTAYWDKGVVGSLLNYFVTINFTTPMLSNPDLETIHLPNADSLTNSTSAWEKGLAFGKGIRVVDRVRWDHTNDNGYTFEGAHGVRADLDAFKLAKAPVWNMSRTSPATVRITSSLYRYVNGTFQLPALDEKTTSTTIAPMAGYSYSMQMGLPDFVDDLRPADTLFGLQVELFNASNQRVDDFDVVFEWHPLRIVSIDPDSGEAGDDVTITGLGFGREKGVSKVKFNGIEAEIVSWHNDEIVATAPANVSTGDVTVEIGPAASNGMRFMASGGLLDVLHTTASVMIYIDGLHTYSPSNYTSPYGMWIQSNSVVWSGTSFSVNAISPQGETVTITGDVTPSGDSVRTIDALFTKHESSPDPGMTMETHFVLKDIPLAIGYVPQPSVFYEISVDGSTQGSHVTTLVKSIVWDDGTDYQTYRSTDWNSTTTPPKLSVTFGPDYAR